jgi:hypothetical protein
MMQYLIRNKDATLNMLTNIKIEKKISNEKQESVWHLVEIE